jgi:L-ascorbate metabolism protein UlaG (beta-lactamase superfamily)
LTFSRRGSILPRMKHLGWTTSPESIAAILSRPPGRKTSLLWLGQAGFIVETDGLRVMIDPYLSDSLLREYPPGTVYPHYRMMPPPVLPTELGRIDLVLSTHYHTDHYDEDTLGPALRDRPGLRLVAPKSLRARTIDNIRVAADRFIGLDAGDTFSPAPGVVITATRSAHEALERDANGHHVFLGYTISGPGGTIWHSGDCIPFDGLVDEVKALKPDLALMPINGRRADLSAHGIVGNFNATEAIGIARKVGSANLIMHHYGMFAFNTVPPESLDAIESPAGLGLRRVRLNERYELTSN